MKEKTTYICENCGDEFEWEDSCRKHEDTCLNKIGLYTNNVQLAIDQIKEEYKTLIESIDFTIADESFEIEGTYISNFKSMVTFTLSNKNKAYIQFNPKSQNECFETIKQEIENKLSTIYEGFLDWNCGGDRDWRTNYIGDVDVEDIVDRLRNRKVRLEVID